MIHPETHACTKTNGPRPAGPKNKCFYCGVAIGEQHNGECALRKRTVIVRVSFDLLQEVPEFWTAADVTKFFGNESGNCATNFLEQLDHAVKDRDEDCACNLRSGAQFVREATQRDEAEYRYKNEDV